MSESNPVSVDWADEFFDTKPSVKPTRPIFSRAWFPWFVVLAIFVVLACIFSPVAVIPSGHRGIATFFGDTEGEIYTEGIHFKYPLLRVHKFDIRTQVHEVPTSVVTKDMQLVSITVTTKFHLDENLLKATYQEVGTEYETVLLEPAVKEAVNLAATRFTARELTGSRQDFTASVQAELENHLLETGLKPDDVAVTQVTFSRALTEAYEAKLVAEQQAKIAETELKTASDKAEAIDILTKSEADKIKSIGQAMRGNEAYIQYEILEKWDGRSPLYLAPLPISSTVPETTRK